MKKWGIAGQKWTFDLKILKIRSGIWVYCNASIQNAKIFKFEKACSPIYWSTLRPAKSWNFLKWQTRPLECNNTLWCQHLKTQKQWSHEKSKLLHSYATFWAEVDECDTNSITVQSSFTTRRIASNIFNKFSGIQSHNVLHIVFKDWLQWYTDV